MKTIKKVIVAFVVSLLFVSCALESKFGLPQNQKNNPELIGEWYVDDHKEERLKIVKKDDNIYKLVLKDKEKTEEIDFYTKTIKGCNILNLVDTDKGNTTNIFYAYKIDGDMLKISEVNDKLVSEDFSSDDELLEFFENNVTKDDFLLDSTVLVRAQ